MMVFEGTAMQFGEWLGENYVKLHGVWVPRFADQRNKKNYKTTKELWKLFWKQKMAKP